MLGSKLFALAPYATLAYGQGPDVTVDWTAVSGTSKTTNTLQVVVNPLLLSNSSIHGAALDSLRLVSADYVRFVPWYPYPKLAVPEIDPPQISATSCQTSWDFTYADQFLGEFLNSTQGKKHIINFSTTPEWMWADNGGGSYPPDVNTIDFDYQQGTQLRDPSMKELADYYQRIINWYVNGGFTDECGVYHHSGYKWPIEFWEVLNECQAEHSMSPGFYNQVYDAITAAIHQVAPDIQFVGGALAVPNATWVESFLNESNHAAGITLDWFSYHYYAQPVNADTTVEATDSFQQTDNFINQIIQFNGIRDSLCPDCKITINELGTFNPLAGASVTPGYVIPPEYWSWSGGIFAYIFAKASPLGIDALGESQLVGYPGQFESVSMVDYTTGEPNARLRVLQLLQQNFSPGDLILTTTVGDEASYHAQAYQSSAGQKKLLLINKLNQTQILNIEGFDQGQSQTCDVSTGGDAWRTDAVSGNRIELTPYGTMVLTTPPS